MFYGLCHSFLETSHDPVCTGTETALVACNVGSWLILFELHVIKKKKILRNLLLFWSCVSEQQERTWELHLCGNEEGSSANWSVFQQFLWVAGSCLLTPGKTFPWNLSSCIVVSNLCSICFFIMCLSLYELKTIVLLKLNSRVRQRLSQATVLSAAVLVHLLFYGSVWWSNKTLPIMSDIYEYVQFIIHSDLFLST